ncbi:hypothetical protein Bhyg_14220 [Pseudolycoriella hygida]|uniref:Uncharacterized protein n=1 Tax=Pseudolycoriella hygida TaxID=35572 RepID=A0A9Q0MQ61_9DIPT|nr:hypothetical protein Bhyg_14220 [Pseudolycoriella hygida]
MNSTSDPIGMVKVK